MENETGCELFTRLLNSQKKPPDTTSSETEQTATTQQQPAQQHNPALISQLESILVTSKPLNLDRQLFSSCPIGSRQVVEIYGRVGVGKSELLMHFVARCLLPPRWRIPRKRSLGNQTTTEFIEIDLSQYSCYESSAVSTNQSVELGQQQQHQPQVILIQTDSNSNMLRLFTILEQRLTNALVSQHGFFQRDDKTTETLVRKFARECMKSLVVYECFSREQFLLALAALEPYLQSLLTSPNYSHARKIHVIPIFIDSINSNFEISDRYESSLNLCDNDHTEKYTIQLIRRLFSKFNVCVIATRADFTIFFDTNTSSSYCSYKKWQAFVNYKIELETKESCLEETDAAASATANDDDLLTQLHDRIARKVENKLTLTTGLTGGVTKTTFTYSIDNSGFRLTTV